MHNIDESQKLDMEKKKPGTKEYMLHNSVYNEEIWQTLSQPGDQGKYHW